MFKQFPEHCNHKPFILLTRAVGEFLDYEIIKETQHMEKARSSQEMLEHKKYCEELDEEEKILQVLNLKSIRKRMSHFKCKSPEM